MKLQQRNVKMYQGMLPEFLERVADINKRLKPSHEQDVKQYKLEEEECNRKAVGSFGGRLRAALKLTTRAARHMDCRGHG